MNTLFSPECVLADAKVRAPQGVVSAVGLQHMTKIATQDNMLAPTIEVSLEMTKSQQ